MNSEQQLIADLQEYCLEEEPTPQQGGSAEAAARTLLLMSMDETIAYGQMVWAPFHEVIDAAFPFPKGQRDTREYQAVQAVREKVKTLGRLYVWRFHGIRTHQECAEMALLVKKSGRLAPCDQVEGITVPEREPWERRKDAERR